MGGVQSFLATGHRYSAGMKRNARPCPRRGRLRIHVWGSSQRDDTGRLVQTCIRCGGTGEAS